MCNSSSSVIILYRTVEPACKGHCDERTFYKNGVLMNYPY